MRTRPNGSRHIALIYSSTTARTTPRLPPGSARFSYHGNQGSEEPMTGPTTRVRGTLENTNGTPACGVSVTATSSATGVVYSSTTNASGGFQFDLPPSDTAPEQYYTFKCSA